VHRLAALVAVIGRCSAAAGVVLEVVDCLQEGEAEDRWMITTGSALGPKTAISTPTAPLNRPGVEHVVGQVGRGVPGALTEPALSAALRDEPRSAG